jgi:hypothetical protein
MVMRNQSRRSHSSMMMVINLQSGMWSSCQLGAREGSEVTNPYRKKLLKNRAGSATECSPRFKLLSLRHQTLNQESK